MRDHRADYEHAGVVVLGISPDPVKRIGAFDQKYGLGFPLLADEDHSVAEAYGVWVEKSMYGRKYMGMERSTFVISSDGVVTHVFRKVKPAARLAHEGHGLGKHDRHHAPELLRLLFGRALDVDAVDRSDGQIDRELDRVVGPREPLRALHLLGKFSQPALKLFRVSE